MYVHKMTVTQGCEGVIRGEGAPPSLRKRGGRNEDDPHEGIEGGEGADVEM